MEKRFEQLEAAGNSLSAETLRDIERQYRAAQKEIEGKISVWFGRLAENNGVSLSEARRMLSKAELKEFKWDVKDYIKYGEENALNGKWMKQLENASARYHISKLEALKLQIRQSVEALFAKQEKSLTEGLSEVYKMGYYNTAYELQRGFNKGFNVGAIDQRQVEKILAKPWAVDGVNFSDRIWNNKDRLVSELHNQLTRSVLTGADPQKAIDAIAKKMNTSKSNAGRLVMTEGAYFSSAAQKDCFNDLGVEKYEIVATLDSHTSEICRSLDGRVYPMKDYEAGVTAPPFHVRCRSTTVPYFDDDFGEIGERAARGEDGKTYYVPADMTYKEWKATFVDNDVANSAESGIM
ncbi:MAG: minor capsid protein, partial [Clostridiales bacterium]|nr:minor capsid protein [Clostridiales bacterium]